MISLNNISIYLEDNLIIKSLSTKAHAGDVILVTGKNGSGKTTLLKAISGFINIFSGAITHHEKINYLGHQNGLRTSLTANDNLSLWLDASEKEKAIQTWQLEPLLNMPVHQLSQGQKKRIALAITLTQEAGIYVLDEPSANLDDDFKKILKTTIKAKSDKVFIIASHDKKLFKATQEIAL